MGSEPLPVFTPSAKTAYDEDTIRDVLSSFEKVKNASKNDNHNETIETVLDTTANINQLQMLSVLDYRAHALSTRCKFEAGIEVATTMIKLAPTASPGYLRLGNLLSMQGKQARAVTTYQDALKKVSSDDPDYEQLVEGEKVADEKNSRRMDLMTALPLEIVDEIVTSFLSEEERAKLLFVSKSWLERLANSQIAWKTIYNDHEQSGHFAIAQVLPLIAGRIENLTIWGIQRPLVVKYLQHLENGDFTRLKSLEIPYANSVIDENSLMSLTTGLWKMRYTLTKVSLMFRYFSATITITDILFYCPNLECLSLETHEGLRAILGDIEQLQDTHSALVELALDTIDIDPTHLKPLLQVCPYIRWLHLRCAPPKCLDLVCDYCPNLEVLGFSVPRNFMSDAKEILNQNYHKHPATPLNGDRQEMQREGRLRAFYFINQEDVLPGAEFMRILQKNCNTLEVLSVNLSEEAVQERHQQLYPPYVTEAKRAGFKMDRLSSLGCWGDAYGVFETLLFQSIGPALKHVDVTRPYNISAIIDVLNTLPTLETLKLIDCPVNDVPHNANGDIIIQHLVHLFKTYGEASIPESRTSTLKTLVFENCDFVTDDVLDAVADVKTIKNLNFHGIQNITSQGFKNFINKMKIQQNGHGINELILSDILDVINDDMLLDLVDTMSRLKTLKLEIPEITDDGIKKLVDKAKELRNLTIYDLEGHISQETVDCVNSNRKGKHVKLIRCRRKDI